MQATTATTEVDAPHGIQARKEPGVARIEAMFRVFTNKRSHWLLYACIGLIVYVASLQSNTVFNFLVLATSSYGQHSLLGAITVANSILAAVVIPFIAKIADATSRPRTYLFALFFYILGYTMVAASRNVETLAVGQLFANIGDKGISLVNSILIADITPLKWRGWGFAMISTPYIVNAFISAPVVESILSRGPDSWRWGYAIFVIVLPVAFAPALGFLFWAEFKAKQQGVVVYDESTVRESHGVVAAVLHHFEAADTIGLLLLGGAFALLLLPMTLYNQLPGGWNNKGIIIMFVFGAVLMIAFGVWELKFCKKPLMSKRILNKTLLLAIVIDFFYYLGGYFRLLYFSSWVWVVKDYSYGEWTMFNNAMGVGLCAFSLISGAAIRYLQRYKSVQLFGLVFYIVGFGLTVYCRRPDPSTGALVMTQLLISFGGACSVVGSQVAAQASVRHEDMASAIALLSLWTTLGGSIGSAISTALWTSRLPMALAKHLPDVSAEQRALIFGSIDVARNSEPAVRTGVILAYVDTVESMWIAALVLSVVPFIATLFMDNYYLGDTHNAVENTLVSGEHVGKTAAGSDDEGSRSSMAKSDHSVPTEPAQKTSTV